MAENQRADSGPSRIKTFIAVGSMIFVEVILPIILYFILEKYLPVIWALVISGVPPLIVVIVGLIRHRRVDVLGVLIVFSFIVGAIVAGVQGDPRLYLLRESFITGVIGFVFLITLIPIKVGSFRMRPMVFYFSKDMATGGTFGSGGGHLQPITEDESIEARWERYWDSYPKFRQGFIVMTAVWGFGLLIEVVFRVIIIFRAPTIDQAVYIASIATYSWIALLVLFTIVYSRWMARMGQKRLAMANAGQQL
ncbi:17505_t:CDS:1 [Acaulospora morrowiae]|uniref:17505_t:CDS:1 n=1 Tax=Acaulospora morrowiae TaxID=94023 RepID=A0A9N9BYT4_9GLOM|nr:17505_t:CDS:1 [Acaulospora morrowiae]